jgi:hypothetical protein
MSGRGQRAGTEGSECFIAHVASCQASCCTLLYTSLNTNDTVSSLQRRDATSIGDNVSHHASDVFTYVSTSIWTMWTIYPQSTALPKHAQRP